MVASNQEWENAAKNDALYAIASVKGKRNGKWDTADFFAKGEVFVSYIDNHLNKISKDSHVLDIGCGAGRITKALAKRFSRVTGVDVSPTMINLARKLCSDVSNADFKLSNGTDFPINDNSMDLIVSFQVLQHVQQTALPQILNSYFNKLKVHGVAILHIPCPSLAATLKSWTRLVPLRRIITLIVRKAFPDLNYSGRFWANTQYHTYTKAEIERFLLSAGFYSVTSFRWRENDPLTSVYLATKSISENPA